MVKLSKKNIKLGDVINISLPPIVACRPEAPCFEKCYALKSFKQYPSVRAAWNHNFEIACKGDYTYFNSITEQLKALKPKPGRNYFRWHVAGDILDSSYFLGMVKVAAALPNWHFLAYTKQYEIVNDYIDMSLARLTMPLPSNLKVVMSQWPGLDLVNPHALPVATYDAAHGTDCPGSCDKCKACWHKTTDINFPAH